MIEHTFYRATSNHQVNKVSIIQAQSANTQNDTKRSQYLSSTLAVPYEENLTECLCFHYPPHQSLLKQCLWN